MPKNKKYIEELNTLNNMLNVVQTYQEIAAMRMRRTKKSVLNSREFLVDLNDTFKSVTFAYEEYLKRVSKTKETGLLLGKNGKNVYVLVSANMGLYGDILRKTFAFFVKDLKEMPKNTDIVIVGKIGLDMFKNSEFTKNLKYTYFDLSDSGSDAENFSKLLDHVLQYSQIKVFHGFFKSVLLQEPSKTLITGEAAKLEQSLSKNEKVSYLFEPSVESVAKYFEEQVLSSVFEQVTYESNLSKFASRMVSLYSASDNIKTSLKNVDFSMRKYKHKVFNSKQITTLSSVYLNM